MYAYHALCSDCPKCRKENIVFLAYAPHKKVVNIPNLNRVICSHCFHEYHQSTHEMVLRPKTQRPGYKAVELGCARERFRAGRGGNPRYRKLCGLPSGIWF